MYDCSSLVHHLNLIPPEKMLVSYAPPLEGQSLYSFLSKMDEIEYRILQTENAQCQPNPNSLTRAQRFGIGLGSLAVGGFAALYSGAVPGIIMGVPAYNPYAALAGGASSGGGLCSMGKKKRNCK